MNGTWFQQVGRWNNAGDQQWSGGDQAVSMSRWSNSFWKRSKTVRLFQKRRRRPQTALADLLNRFASFALPPGIRSSYRRSRNRRGARPFSAAFSSTTSNTSNHTTAIIQKQIIQPRLYSGDHTAVIIHKRMAGMRCLEKCQPIVCQSNPATVWTTSTDVDPC